MNNKLYSYFLYIFGFIIIEFIITTIFVYIIIDNSLIQRVMKLDFFILMGIVDYEVITKKNIIGIELQYYDYFKLVSFLILIVIIFIIMFVIIFIVKRIKKIKIGKFKKKSFILFIILMTLILFLHFIPLMVADFWYNNYIVKMYNRVLINEGLMTENRYNYFLFKSIININLSQLLNFTEDLILWIIIGYVFILLITYIKNDNR